MKEYAAAVEKGRRNLGVAHCNYAVALMKVKKPEEALKEFDFAIEIDPSNASFYLSNKAHALSQIGLQDKARSIYSQILDRKDVSKETQRIVIKRAGRPASILLRVSRATPATHASSHCFRPALLLHAMRPGN